MKKLIAVFLMCSLLFSMTACQGKTENLPADSIVGSSSASKPNKGDASQEESYMENKISIQEPESQTRSETPVQQAEPGHETQSFYYTHPDGKNIYAELYTPKYKSEMLPLVILGHGYSSSYRYLEGYAEYLVDRNISCCIFDFCGGSDYSFSDGSMLDMSVITQMQDMELVLNTLKESGDFELSRIYIGGESQAEWWLL